MNFKAMSMAVSAAAITVSAAVYDFAPLATGNVWVYSIENKNGMPVPGMINAPYSSVMTIKVLKRQVRNDTVLCTIAFVDSVFRIAGKDTTAVSQSLDTIFVVNGTLGHIKGINREFFICSGAPENQVYAAPNGELLYSSVLVWIFNDYQYDAYLQNTGLVYKSSSSAIEGGQYRLISLLTFNGKSINAQYYKDAAFQKMLSRTSIKTRQPKVAKQLSLDSYSCYDLTGRRMGKQRITSAVYIRPNGKIVAMKPGAARQ